MYVIYKCQNVLKSYICNGPYEISACTTSKTIETKRIVAALWKRDGNTQRIAVSRFNNDKIRTYKDFKRSAYSGK